jgi:acetamidase/formamidase
MGMIRQAALLLACTLSAPHAFAQEALSAYSLTLSVGGTTLYGTLELEQKGDSLTGKYRGDDLTGTRQGNQLTFTARNKEGERAEVRLTVQGRTLTGSETQFDAANHGTTWLPIAVVAEPVQLPASATPRRHEFSPSVFHRAFSAENKPVLTIAPGDVVHTRTVDAAGVDEKNMARSLGGNPETGPFYVAGVVPGDTLAIHIVKLSLNRDWAVSDDYLVRDAVNPGLAVTMKDTGKTIHWHLDRAKGIAMPEKPDVHLGTYAVPLRPMLGCVAVAPPPAFAAPNTGDSGFYGGNMDFNEITEGSTVYLQARVPGGLVYVGDGHAVMGDGELNGNGLETSMDVEFRVEVLPNRPTPSPRVENERQIMALGYEGSLNEALRTATANMQRWLASDYALNPSETAQVIGTAAHIRVTEAADRNAGVALILDKDILKTLRK